MYDPLNDLSVQVCDATVNHTLVIATSHTLLQRFFFKKIQISKNCDFSIAGLRMKSFNAERFFLIEKNLLGFTILIFQFIRTRSNTLKIQNPPSELFIFGRFHSIYTSTVTNRRRHSKNTSEQIL